MKTVSKICKTNLAVIIVILSYTLPVFTATGDKPDNTGSGTIPVYTYRIVRTFPHDPLAFTQGLVFREGILYEGTGIRGRSSLRRTILETGEILQERKLPDQFFGEGVTVYKNTVIQLTWRSRFGFVYDRKNLHMLRAFNFPTEGWGITHDGKRLIMSDGTAKLYFLDPETFKETGWIQVNEGKTPVTRLNELEYVGGHIYANVWKTTRIAIISPGTGLVTGWIELEGISPFSHRNETQKTLNGIAYDEKNDRLFVTGKMWPKIYEIELIPLK